MRRYERRPLASRKRVIWGLLMALLGVQPGVATARASFAPNENLCFWMVALESGQAVSFTRRLEAGVPYRLFVMSNSSLASLDVAVRDSLGRSIARSDASPREMLLKDAFYRLDEHRQPLERVFPVRRPQAHLGIGGHGHSVSVPR